MQRAAQSTVQAERGNHTGASASCLRRPLPCTAGSSNSEILIINEVQKMNAEKSHLRFQTIRIHWSEDSAIAWSTRESCASKYGIPSISVSSFWRFAECVLKPAVFSLIDPFHVNVKSDSSTIFRAEGALSSRCVRYHEKFCLCPVANVELFEARLQKTLFEFWSNSKRFVMRNPELIFLIQRNSRPRPLFSSPQSR